MKTDCEVIRDLLPLYADDVCSDGSRRLIEEHLPECPACSEELKKLRSRDLETGLKEEKDAVLEYGAKRFRRRSTTVGSVIAGLFMIPVLVCLIVNLATGASLGWFLIVLAALAVAASLVIVPLLVPHNKLLWTFCAFCVTLMVLLAVIALVNRGSWFFVAEAACLFGLSVVFLPFVIRAEPVRRLLGDFNRWLLVLGVDVILFANMMNMISMKSKGILATLFMAGLCAVGAFLLFSAIKAKRSEAK